MSDRERWILYPLLTFAISLSVKSQTDLWTLQRVVKVDEARDENERDHVTISCNELTVESPQGRPQVRLSDTENGGEAVIFNTLGKPAAYLGVEKQIGAIETFDAEGRKLVMLTSAGSGGAVVAVRPEEGKAILLSHNPQTQVSGIFEAQFTEKSARIIPRVGWVEVAGSKAKTDEKKP